VATEKRRPDTHGGDARPNHSTVGQERRPSVVIGTIPRYLRPKAVLVFAAEIEARGGTEWWIRPGATGESAHLSHRVSSHILDSEIADPAVPGKVPRMSAVEMTAAKNKWPSSKAHRMAAAGPGGAWGARVCDRHGRLKT